MNTKRFSNLFKPFHAAPLLALLATLLCAPTALGATKTSAATGNWNTAGTWSPSGVPTAADDVVINGNFTVTLDVTTNCVSLTVNAHTANGTSQLSIGAFTLTVTGNVAINGGGNANRIGKILFTSASGILDVGGNVTIGNGSVGI